MFAEIYRTFEILKPNLMDSVKGCEVVKKICVLNFTRHLKT
jgi:hypothetical protein